jgi:putative FmdB family regulatory protein
MPIYEYECGHCRYRFEMKQGFDEEPQAMCPQCQGRARRVFHSTPVIFKGSGFYVTDSRKGKEPETDKGGSETGKSRPEASKSEKGK